MHPPSPIEPPLLTEDLSERTFSASEGEALVRACFDQYRTRLMELVQGSLEMASDLFESNSAVPDGEVEQFRLKRGQWRDRFRTTLEQLFERRLSGERRKGRRPDADASVSSLKVLTAFDHDKQAALVAATNFLRRFTCALKRCSSDRHVAKASTTRSASTICSTRSARPRARCTPTRGFGVR